MKTTPRKHEARQDRDAAWGNDRVNRAAFMIERMRQTGCLQIEALEDWQNWGRADDAAKGGAA